MVKQELDHKLKGPIEAVSDVEYPQGESFTIDQRCKKHQRLKWPKEKKKKKAKA